MSPPLRLERRGGSATVVITLTAEAAERGLEYAEVLAKAKKELSRYRASTLVPKVAP